MIPILSSTWFSELVPPIFLDAAVKGTVLLALSGGIALLLRRASAALRHVVWALAVIALISAPLIGDCTRNGRGVTRPTGGLG